MNTVLSHISHYTPAVFAVRDSYQILLPVHTACTFWVRVGEEEFYDDGICLTKDERYRIED